MAFAVPTFLRGPSELSVSGAKIIASFEIFGVTIRFTETIVLEWIVMAVILGLACFLTHGMKVQGVSKRQAIAEMLVETVTNLVQDMMGKRWTWFTPFVGTIFSFSIFGSLLSLFGLRAVTSDFSVLLTWAIVVFLLITITKFRYGGLKGYLKGFVDPVPFMLPLNIISEVATPAAMALRHFGNIAGGGVITALVYYGLASASRMIGLNIPFLTIGIPAVLSLYFDLFSDFMQAFIFIMLMMVFIGNAGPSEEAQ